MPKKKSPRSTATKKFGAVKPQVLAAARYGGLSVRRVSAGPGKERPPYYLLFTLESERLCARDSLDEGAQWVAIYKERIKAPSNIVQWKYIGLDDELDASIGRPPHGLLKELVEVHTPGRIITDPAQIEAWVEHKISLRKELESHGKRGS